MGAEIRARSHSAREGSPATSAQPATHWRSSARCHRNARRHRRSVRRQSVRIRSGRSERCCVRRLTFTRRNLHRRRRCRCRLRHSSRSCSHLLGWRLRSSLGLLRRNSLPAQRRFCYGQRLSCLRSGHRCRICSRFSSRQLSGHAHQPRHSHARRLLLLCCFRSHRVRPSHVQIMRQCPVFCAPSRQVAHPQSTVRLASGIQCMGAG